jgi:hypothetical protein
VAKYRLLYARLDLLQKNAEAWRSIPQAREIALSPVDALGNQNVK